MLLNLEDKDWSEFFIEDVAEILSGRDIYEAERYAGNTPYISSTAKNNGISHFVGNSNNTLEENCLSVNRNGSVGYSFYHPYKGLFSNDCRKLRPYNKSKYVGLFLSTQICSQRDKYNYGYKMGTARLKRQKVMLPINASGEPDWQFMENYIKALMEQKKAEYIKHCRKELARLKLKDIEPLEDKEWHEFFIEDIAEIKAGRRLTKADMKVGRKPFIGSTDSNNGITAFVANTNSSEDSNILGVNYNGSVVENFYHPYTAIFSDDVKRLSLKSIEGSKYLYLFLKNIILKQKSKYQYAYKFNESRLKRQKIMLPVTNICTPDYEYMSQYMINLEYKKRKEFLDFCTSNTRSSTQEKS
ncbi:restriction endonuclease subunit S [Leptolyngbya sp. KIOST-1]|uniref:restriction endonuclease subunit S n=1 Tax=Leptolyngbya sp. KIOST-1 TaxID=1229172 RepID=UPI0018CE32CB|nr:restriction endonuclease subunit S [Leptolyngbya sp. KIOST-1]